MDAGITAITRTKHCEPFKLVFTDFPEILDNLIPGAIVQIGSHLGINFGPEYVKSSGRGRPKTAQGPAGSPPPPPDLYVEFTSTGLRNAFLEAMRAAKGVDGAVVGIHRAVPGVRIRAFEVLLDDRHDLFNEVRAAADRRRVIVWHQHGSILARPRRGGKIVRIRRVSDLDKVIPHGIDWTFSIPHFFQADSRMVACWLSPFVMLIVTYSDGPRYWGSLRTLSRFCSDLLKLVSSRIIDLHGLLSDTPCIVSTLR